MLLGSFRGCGVVWCYANYKFVLPRAVSLSLSPISLQQSAAVSYLWDFYFCSHGSLPAQPLTKHRWAYLFFFRSVYWLVFIFLLVWNIYRFSPELPSWWTVVLWCIPCWNSQPASCPRTTYRNTNGDIPVRNHSWNDYNFENCPNDGAKELLE